MIISGEAKARLTAWWNHEEVGRPCLLFDTLKNPETAPDTDDLNRYWTDVDFIIDRQMDIINRTQYYFEAVPKHYVNFGSVPLGACFGGELRLVDKETTWNVPFVRDIEDILSLDVNQDNKWWSLIRRTVERSVALSKDHHYVAYPAFSGISDIISSIIGIEPFLVSLIENPNGVKKVSKHLLDVWVRLFRELGAIIDTAGNDGYVGSWTGAWSPGRSFPLQEDVSYMLSTEMFEEFCLPCIDALMQEMEYPCYHLDGKGAIKFLDSLLGLEKLKVIQWEPGAGHQELSQWHEMIGYILSRGKSVLVGAREEEIEPLVKAVGSKGLLLATRLSDAGRAKFEAM